MLRPYEMVRIPKKQNWAKLLKEKSQKLYFEER